MPAPNTKTWREKLFSVIFEADTPAGKAFDIILLILILLSIGISIPQSVYWSIVTITTVGYGDISPVTPLGKFIASFIMLLGYAIIAVPTGIVTVEMSRKQADTGASETRSCPSCGAGTHAPDAKYCKYCGHEL